MTRPQESRSFREQNPKWRGFTIVELLIVVVVIAILAAITVVAYRGISNQAKESALKADLTTAAKQLHIAKVETGSFPVDESSLKRSTDTSLTYTHDGDNFCLAAASVSTPSLKFSISSSGAISKGLCPIAATAVSVGVDHTCALASNNQAYCWGSGSFGQLGNGTDLTRPTPTAVERSGVLEGKTATEISAAQDRSCAIADGAAYCWGSNTDRRLGDSTVTHSSSPVAVNTSGVLAGKTVTAISSGTYHTCVIADGSAFCWGSKSHGQLGDGTTNGYFVATPVAVDNSGVLASKTVTAISSGTHHTCAIADGSVYCWGGGQYGQLGDGSAMVAQRTPVAVDVSGVLTGKAVTQISAGDRHTCAIADGLGYCWGSGEHGRLGDGGTANRLSPVAVDASGVLAGKTVTAISSGINQTCAIAEQSVYCWGSNGSGQLGDGTMIGRLLPVAVDTAGVLAGRTAVAISTSVAHTCAIADRSVYCWGSNTGGRLGDGTMANRIAPVKVSPFPEI